MKPSLTIGSKSKSGHEANLLLDQKWSIRIKSRIETRRIGVQSCYTGSKSFTVPGSYTELKLSGYGLVKQGRNCYNNPRWKEQVAARVDASTPFEAASFTLMASEPAYVSWKQQRGFGVGIMDGISLLGDSYFPIPVAKEVTAVDQIARSRFYNKMAEDVSPLTFLGELRQTLHMIRRPALQLRRGLDVLIKRNLFERKKALRNVPRKVRKPTQSQKDARAKALKHAHREYRKAVAGTWLEWRWGALPLMSDISGFIKLAAAMSATPAIQEFSVSATRGMRDSFPVADVGDSSFYTYTSNNLGQRVLYTSVRYKGAIKCPISTTSSFTDIGFAPVDFIPAAWELLPHSWLLDYWANIGDVLGAVATATRMEYAWCNRTTRQTTLDRVDLRPHKFPVIQRNDAFQPGYALGLKHYIKRSPVANVPIPAMQWRYKLGTTQGLNIAAFVQLRGRDISFRNRLRN